MFSRKVIGISASFLLIAVSAGLSPSAHAVTVNADDTITDSVPGLTGFATDGSLMDGLSVTLIFSNAGAQTAVFGGIGGTVGAASHASGWSVTVAGDTFDPLAWAVSGITAADPLIGMILDGRPGLTVFDRTDDSAGPPSFVGQGTSGSASGRDFDVSLADPFDEIVATYSRNVGVSPGAPVGDIWHVLTVDFSDWFAAGQNVAGVTTSFAFSQDTDNDSRRTTTVPEPASIGLLGLGLLTFGLRRRRRN